MMRNVSFIAIAIVALLAGLACEQHRSATAAAKMQSAQDAAVHRIELPHYAPMNLPAGPGRDAFAGGCLSCPSTRYITTQPPLTAAQWEQNVRKMIKTYGAPVTEAQIPQIVQYLLAARESGRRGTWATLAASIPPDAAVPDITLASDSAARQRDQQRGSKLYAKNCASCHGGQGAGDGIAAPTMLPRPSDLTAGRYSDVLMAQAVRFGVPGTAMPAFPTFGDADLRALVTFTRTLQPAPTPAPATASASAQTKDLYAQNCLNCHGATGAADGIAAAPLARPPASFRAKQPAAARAASVIADGIPGSAMPGWKAKLSDSQRDDLAGYVRTFFDAPSAK
jgi:mono/diheme cytochrome c family protein